jgi:penicillin-binding protein 1C
MSRSYLGVVPAGEALARSLNVPAARSLREYGVDRFARLLRTLGLSTLFRQGDDYGLPLILGGAEVTLWEITGLYAGLARAVYARDDFFTSNNATQNNETQRAIFFTPKLFLQNEEEKSSLKKNKKNDDEKIRAAQRTAISSGAAWLTLQALVGAVRPGEEAHWQEYASARRIAWKTGTSFGLRDAWAIGVTPQWTVGVWVGNASGEGRAELRSAVTSAPVLFELFSALEAAGTQGAPRERWFLQPASQLRSAEVCARSGFLAGQNCAETKIIDIPINAAASRACPFCRTVILNAAEDRIVTLGASGENAREDSQETVERKWFVLPPAEEWFYRRWNLDYRPLPLPEQNENVSSARQANNAFALFNPESGAQIFIPRDIDGREGRIVFSAAHRSERAVLHWHLDETYLGSTETFHELEARPAPGAHTLTLIDNEGNTITRRFTVLDG